MADPWPDRCRSNNERERLSSWLCMLCAVSGIFISLPTTTYNKMILYGMWQRSLTLRMLLQSAIATAFNTLNVIYSWLPAKHHFNVNVMCVQYDDNGLSSLKHAQLVRHANSKAATTRTTTAKWKWALDGDFFFCFVSHSTEHTTYERHIQFNMACVSECVCCPSSCKFSKHN